MIPAMKKEHLWTGRDQVFFHNQFFFFFALKDMEGGFLLWALLKGRRTQTTEPVHTGLFDRPCERQQEQPESESKQEEAERVELFPGLGPEARASSGGAVE
jgi:hypothetical protein